MDEFATTWLNYAADGSELAAGSKRKHREYLSHLSHAFFWKYPLTGITTEDINRWLADLDNFGGATPRKKTFQLLKSVYAKAVAEGAVPKSPVSMKAPAVPKSRQAQIPPATPEELQEIYANMPKTTRLSVWLGAILDLRIGEVVSLQVKDWNPKTQTLRVCHSADENGGLKATKTATSNTTQPVPPQLGKLLEEACDGKNPTDFIVTCSDGTHITPNRLRDHFNEAKINAGRPDLHFHTLRATSITAAVATGASLKDTMQWGRHADAQTSIERYQRASGTERMREIANGIEDTLMGHDPTLEELNEEITATKKTPRQARSPARRLITSPKQVSERIRVNVTPTPDLVRLDTASSQQVIDVLPGTLQVRHRVGNGHERRQLILPHNHPLPCSQPHPTGQKPRRKEPKPRHHGREKRPSGSTVGSYAPD
nr:site-specific integrase [Bifidobacterium pseudocatenulatum]